jgi:hypothetical protein
MNNNLTNGQLERIIECADEVLSALAGTNEDVHRDDSTKMCRLWDDLNDTHAPPEVVRAMARELQEYRKAAPVEINDEMAFAFCRAISDDAVGSDELEDIKTGLRAAFANITTSQQAPAVEAVPVFIKDHQIRELVNDLRDIAVEYHGTHQLRERIASTVSAAMQQPVSNRDELPDGLLKAAAFYRQVERENPPVETGAWKDAVDWIIREALAAAPQQEVK